jgi:molybdopterin molybdotransferase
MSPKRMTLFDEASRTVQEHARFLGAERVDIKDAFGRVLVEDVSSDIDMPPFNKSAMDGFACRRGDLSGSLEVVETIAAGRVPKKVIGPGECAKIMTGAIVPEGADCVIRVEDTRKQSEKTVRFTEKETPDNICLKGEDLKAGDMVLEKGEVITPQHIGVLATVGCPRPLVGCRPKVGIIATGDELVEPGEKPGASQIRNSNSYQLQAQVTAVGAVPEYLGIAGDTETELEAAIERASAESDVVLVSGGVSMGDFDLVPGILVKKGFHLLFKKIAVKPGMPTVFGCSERAFCFGLPGNPVSTFVIFEILVKPFLLKLMGHDHRPAVVSMRLDGPVKRRKADRDSWIPVRCNVNGGIEALDYHGSAHLNALSRADGLLCIPRGIGEIKKGAFVDVRWI